MTEDQFKALAETAKKIAGDGCAGCFARKASLPTRVQELVEQLGAAGVSTFAELDAKKATDEGKKEDK
jgi:hypothetical protein